MIRETKKHRHFVKPALITQAFPVIAGLLVAGAAGVSLSGWVFDRPALIDWFNTGITIKANAALGLMIAGIALVLARLSVRSRWLVKTLAGFVTLIGLLTLVEHITRIDLGIDTLLFDEPAGALATAAPGRMGPPCSSSLVVLGVALIFSTFAGLKRWTGILATIVTAVAALSIVGYMYGADQLYSLPYFSGIALQTAIMIFVLGAGVAALSPERGLYVALALDDVGGEVARRLFLPLMIIALLLGALTVIGQQIGLFDSAFGTAVRTVLEMVMLLTLLSWAAGHISRSVRERRMISQMPAENPNPVMRLTPTGNVLYANPAAGSLLEGTGRDFIGQIDGDLRELANAAYFTKLRRTADIEFNGVCYTCTAAPITDGGYVNIYFNDISERKRSEDLLERRVHELSVLYHFTDASNRAITRAEVYDAALEAITSAFGCRRASILLFNEEGVMPFVASRGLSDEYRRAVTGHTPWQKDEVNAKPFGISDIETADEPAEIKETVLREGIRALGFIPMIANGELIGKFMFYYDEPHEFTDAELELAMTIAFQLAFDVGKKRIETALLENEERLRLATQIGKVGVWDWAVRTDRVTWTDAVYSMHGVGAGEFGGSVDDFAALVHPDDKERVRSSIERALEGSAPYDIEFRIVRPDTGETSWLDTTAIVLRDEAGPYRMIGATTDVTERKLTELEMGKLAAIVETSVDAIVSKDINGVVTSWNRAAEELFGYKADEAIGRHITFLIPDDRLSEEDEILSRIRSNQRIEHFETVRRAKDGRLIEISLSISPILDSAGNIIGASKIARDVTERNAAAAAFREREMMQSIVEAQESERNRIARDLHDHLGQRLTALRLKLQSILDNASPEDALAGELETACSSAQQIDNEINYLAWELRPTELERFGLGDALASFVREWSSTYGIAAEFHGSDERVGRMTPDIETNLYRIAQEGLNNVLKHARASHVSVLLDGDQHNVSLIIEDDGIGFKRNGNNSKSKSGPRLGLRGMRERAMLLGGTLEVESQPGGGTTVFARVPLRKPNGRSGSGLDGDEISQVM